MFVSSDIKKQRNIGIDFLRVWAMLAICMGRLAWGDAGQSQNVPAWRKGIGSRRILALFRYSSNVSMRDVRMDFLPGGQFLAGVCCDSWHVDMARRRLLVQSVHYWNYVLGSAVAYP